MAIKLNVIVDMKPVLDVSRYAKHNKPKLLDVATKRYLQFLRRRYLTQSSGAGGWDDLEDETVQRKERRGVTPNPEAILREFDEVLGSLGIKMTSAAAYVGIVHNLPHPRGNSTIGIATIHQEGLGVVPVREIIPVVSSANRRRIVDDIRKAYEKVIRANRRNK